MTMIVVAHNALIVLQQMIWEWNSPMLSVFLGEVLITVAGYH